MATAETSSEDIMSTVEHSQPASTESTTSNVLDIQKETPALKVQKPFTTYTRSQILYLSKSPLVVPPPDMPDLKDWFGIEHDTNHKKDVEPTTPGSARERRFRRDADDGETPSRPTFRSALSQPSQMGNFKHQSVRAERDRDRDTDKDRERDIRDKEGQERLRHLSDKYDRERLAFPSGVGRTKERDIAPHLAAGPSTRLSAANQTAATNRRADGPKKKAGEVSEDWRKGTDLRSKDEKSDPGRKEDRAPDSSPRRDRGEEDETEDDPRRWRDDGKRNERIAARRDKNTEKRVPQDTDASDRRWTVVEERDVRTKRSSGRERRVEESKDERKEREREKEPAWMDTYIPASTPGSGILGAKTEDGELDGIQAWKKGIKDKEDKEREKTKKHTPEPQSQLDEIQLFKLMMKKEEKKKHTDTSPPSEPIRGPPVFPESNPQSTSSAELGNLLGILSVSSGAESNSQPGGTAATSRLFREPLPQANSYQLQASERNPLEVPAQFNPPQGSRLLAFGSRSSSAAKVPTANSQAPFPNGLPVAAPSSGQQNAIGVRPPPASDVPRGQRGFSPFDPSRVTHEETNESRRTTVERPSFGPEHGTFTESEPPSELNNFQGKAGSRFAKFFDGKTREGVQQLPTQKPSEFIAPSAAINGQRFEQNNFSSNGGHGGHTDQRAIDDIFAMLNNSSSQVPRVNQVPAGNVGFRQAQTLTPQQQQHLLQQQQLQQQQQHQHILSNGRLEALYESRLDDRNFTPDGMVPGLRSVAAPRSRDNTAMYELLDDSMHYNGQRVPQQQQQRSLEQMYSGHVPPMFGQQAGAVRNLAINQSQYRGGPSPGLQQNRIPAGLANLGGRPPHEPQQAFGYNSGQSIGPQPQQAFNNFLPPQPPQNFNHFNAGLPFAGAQQQMRHAAINHNIQPQLIRQQQLQQLQAQQQLAAMGRGSMQTPLINIQQNHLQQQNHLPSHIQQQPQHQGNNADLMALLMGRE